MGYNSLRVLLGLVLVVQALITLGCTVDKDSSAPSGDQVTCGAGEIPLAAGGCSAVGVPPDLACPPGELALPQGGCQPAGVPAEACAEGFVSDGRGGCDAVLPAMPCPPGQTALPGESACREISPCEGGKYGDIPLEEGTQFVDQSYPDPDSDGSQSRPWRTIGEGLVAARNDAIVAVAAGRYRERLLLEDKPVRIWGRCAREVEIAGNGEQLPAVSVGASGAELHRVSVTGRTVALLVNGASSVVLDSIWAHDTADHVIEVVDVDGASSVTLRGSLVERGHNAGLFVYGAEVELEDSVVRDIALDPSGNSGAGIIAVVDGATGARSSLTVRGAVIERTHSAGVFVGASDATIESSVLRDSESNRDDKGGSGIELQSHPMSGERAKATVRTSLVERSRGVGVVALGSDLVLETSVVRDTFYRASDGLGRGVLVGDAKAMRRGVATIRASLFERNHEAGVIIVGSDATIEGILVRDTVVEDNAPGGAIAAQSDWHTGERSAIDLRGSVAENNAEFGVVVMGSDATIEQLVVRGTQPIDIGYGMGISVSFNPGAYDHPTNALIRACLVEQNHVAGILIDGADATVESTTVLGTQQDYNGDFGDGLLATSEDFRPTKIVVTQVRSEANARAGMLIDRAVGAVTSSRSRSNRFGAVLQSTDVSIDDDTLLEQSSERDLFVSGGELAIPDSPAALP